mgnify:CR=1 FL=1
MRVELINILESNEATNELPDYFNSESSQVFPILKKFQSSFAYRQSGMMPCMAILNISVQQMP